MDYFSTLKKQLSEVYSLAQEARKKGYDPELDVEVKIAKDVASRVEGIVGPPGIATLIRSMVEEGLSRENVAFEITRKIAKGEVISGSKEELLEQAVRTGLSILTEGVLVAPTEGIAKIKIKKQGLKEYAAIYYAGPIRSAGGTAAALSAVLTDIARRELGIPEFKATEEQILRYLEEIITYETRCAHLQYLPPEEHIRTIVSNIPICIDGEPTEEVEVSAYRNVEGFETNRVRSGVALVICDGIALKSAKVMKYAKKLNLGWEGWLEKIIKVKKKSDKIEIVPDATYLDGLVAGRPVFSHPSAKGGFRLRYGKSRTNGLMAKNIHPATMILLEGFLAVGTQMKLERPGKGCVVAPLDSLEPPVVLLNDGSVVKVRTVQQAYSLKERVKKILFLGDILCNYGDFLKSNHPLIPGGFCEEWWFAEIKDKRPNSYNVRDLFSFSEKESLPLHPKYTFYWSDISGKDVVDLIQWIKKGRMDNNKLILPVAPEKRILEELLVEHTVVSDEVVIEEDLTYALLRSLGVQSIADLNVPENLEDLSGLAAVRKLSGLDIRAMAPTYIGGRMGRPEKAKERAMDGSPHVLFPTGSFKTRNITKLCKMFKEDEKAFVEIVRFYCKNCNKINIYKKCPYCGGICEREDPAYDKREIDIKQIYSQAIDLTEVEEEVKGVEGLFNPTRTPERLEKGLLRAKYGVFVFRDGTSRFDATDVPLTHFTPEEIGITVEKAKELGYTKDWKGNPLVSASQLIELKPQDVLLSEKAAEYFINVAKFVDDLLVSLYRMKPYYRISKKEDLIGHLAVGLSPHTSAGVLCRIIGFTRANVGYAHPFFHAAKRRNCDADEDSLMLLLDCLLNFSRAFLSDRRGGTMDAPLVLTTELDPKEVDDEAHSIEVVNDYSLEFYRATERIVPPGEINMDLVENYLGESITFGLTHPGGKLDDGNIRTSYVTLQSVPEKIEVQFNLQEKIRAVDNKDAAERLILSHFIPDIYGNLRSFSRQTFRCVSCNTIYRRVPLKGKCEKDGGNIILTINKGGIKKYLDITQKIIEKYDLPTYMKQRIDLVHKEIKNIFEDEKVRQTDLSDFI